MLGVVKCWHQLIMRADVASGMAALHEAGLVHRDLAVSTNHNSPLCQEHTECSRPAMFSSTRPFDVRSAILATLAVLVTVRFVKSRSNSD